MNIEKNEGTFKYLHSESVSPICSLINLNSASVSSGVSGVA